MNWLMEYANNFANAMFWPLLALTLIAIFIGFVSWEARDNTRNKMDPHTVEYSNATWRIHATVQGTLISWLLWFAVYSVPLPNYIYRNKEVVREVSVGINYDKAFDLCWDNRRYTDYSSKENYDHCDAKAKELVLGKPDVRVEVRPETKFVLAPETTQYRTLFNMCMGKDLQEGGWALGDDAPPDARDKRIQLCHNQSMQAVSTRQVPQVPTASSSPIPD